MNRGSSLWKTTWFPDIFCFAFSRICGFEKILMPSFFVCGQKGDISMSECTHDCSSCGADCSSRDLKAPANAKSNIKKVIAVVSGKGGVGKSTVTASLAAAMAKRGRKVAVLDADITGPSIPTAFGIHERAMATEDGIQPAVTAGGIKIMSLNLLTENETDPVIWRGPVIAGVVTQFWTDVVWGDVDYMFVDMPPGTGDVPLTVFQSLPVDGIIVVTSPQDLVSMIVTKAVHMAQMMSIPVLGLIENYSYYQCPDCGAKHAIFGESHLEQEAMQLGLPLLAQLPINPELAAAIDMGKAESLPVNYLEGVAEQLDV
jgi:Mrp family chromosome partitioning ATPase